MGYPQSRESGYILLCARDVDRVYSSDARFRFRMHYSNSGIGIESGIMHWKHVTKIQYTMVKVYVECAIFCWNQNGNQEFQLSNRQTDGTDPFTDISFIGYQIGACMYKIVKGSPLWGSLRYRWETVSAVQSNDIAFTPTHPKLQRLSRSIYRDKTAWAVPP